MLKENNKRALDLGNDPVVKTVFKLAYPIVIAQVVNLLYGIVDRIYIGQIPVIGGRALSGLGVAMPILIIASAFAALVGMGASPLCSIKLGEGNREGANKIVTNSFFVLTILGLVLTAVILIFKDNLLHLFGAIDSVFPYASDYLSVYSFGTIFVMYAIGMNTFINAQGRTMRGMFSILIGAVANIILDPIFIFAFDMGTKGAALATIISQFLSAVFVITFLFSKKSTLTISFKNFVPDKKIILGFLALGISPFIMQSTEAAIQIIYNNQIGNFGGDLKEPLLTVMTICLTTMQIVSISGMSFCQGAAPFLSYNFGAGKFDRIKKALKIIVIVPAIATIILSSIAIFLPQIYILMFNSEEALVLELGKKYLPIFFVGFAFMGIQNAFQTAFMAFRQTKRSMFLALLRKVILLIPLLLILPNFMGVQGIFYSEAISDILAALATTITFVFSYKKIMEKRKTEIEKMQESLKQRKEKAN